MTLNQNRRNSIDVICTLIAIVIASTLFFSFKNTAAAQLSPFEIPLNELPKINPENVVSFHVFEYGAKSPNKIIVEMNTRAGFKIYGKGLEFGYRALGGLLVEPLQFTSEPQAESAEDPWYHEMRSSYSSGTLFSLARTTEFLPEGEISIKFEACSVSNCLLPTTFALAPAKGAVAKIQKISTQYLPGASTTENTLASAKPALPQGLAATESTAAPVNKVATVSSVSIPDQVSLWVQGSLSSHSWTLFFWLFVAGLLMNLTPCVYPMIPITLNVLSSFGQTRTFTPDEFGSGSSAQAVRNRRRRLLPLVYLAGMIISYSSMGVVAGMTGSLFGSLLQSSAFTIGLSIVMFIMGFSMLGLFDMTTVQRFATKIPIAEKYPVAGVLTMGAVSGLISAPCTGPVLSALLLLIGQSKDPFYGFTLMSFYAFGFGFPYVFLGFFTQKLGRLPKAGWLLRSVKLVFAALMFALGLYYIKPILGRILIVSIAYERPSFLTVALSIFLTGGFIALGQLTTVSKNKSFTAVLSQVGTVISLTLLALWFTLQLTSGFVAPVSMAQNIGQSTTQDIPQPAENSLVVWEKNWRSAVQRATVEHKPLLVDAWAEWCAACLKMDATTWNNPILAKTINDHFVALKLDFTRTSEFSEKIIARWDITGLPAVAIFSANGNFDAVPQVLVREAVDSEKLSEIVKPFL